MQEGSGHDCCQCCGERWVFSQQSYLGALYKIRACFPYPTDFDRYIHTYILTCIHHIYKAPYSSHSPKRPHAEHGRLLTDLEVFQVVFPGLGFRVGGEVSCGRTGRVRLFHCGFFLDETLHPRGGVYNLGVGIITTSIPLGPLYNY